MTNKDDRKEEGGGWEGEEKEEEEEEEEREEYSQSMLGVVEGGLIEGWTDGAQCSRMRGCEAAMIGGSCAERSCVVSKEKMRRLMTSCCSRGDEDVDAVSNFIERLSIDGDVK
jgi:hypothetical protein